MNEPFEDEKYLAKGWDDCDTVAEERSGGMFLKVEDGKSALVNCVGQPEIYEKVFDQAKGPTTRAKVDVFVPGENKLKTWDMPVGLFKTDLKRHRERRGPEFVDAVLEVGRKGSGKETRWWLDYVRQLTQVEKDLRDTLIGA
jgi:hypothetical protein